MANALHKITIRAKKIRKNRPGMKWKTAIKEASADYHAGRIRNKINHKPAKSHKRHSRKKVSAIETKSKVHTDYNKPEVNISIGGLKRQLRKKLNETLDKKVIRKFRATGKRERRKIQKEITAVKSELRKLKLF